MLVFAVVFWVVIGLLLLGAVAFVFSVLIRPEQDQEEVVHQHGLHTLTYLVPTGQDPAASRRSTRRGSPRSRTCGTATRCSRWSATTSTTGARCARSSSTPTGRGRLTREPVGAISFEDERWSPSGRPQAA